VFIHGVASSQSQDTIAIVPPFLDRQERDDWDGAIRLIRQDVVIFLYQNFATVYTEATFVNTSQELLNVEVSLPSMGYTVQDDAGRSINSKGLLGTRIWIEGQRVVPEVQQSGDDIWYSITPLFLPGKETEIRALLWVPTTLGQIGNSAAFDTSIIPRGQRELFIFFSNAAMWSEIVDQATFLIVLKDGLTGSDSMFQVYPKDPVYTDSTLQWSLEDTEPINEDNIVVRYNTTIQKRTPLNYIRKIYDFIMKDGFDELTRYVDMKQK